MIKVSQTINPHVSKNLQYNQLFIQDLDEHSRIGNEIKTIPEAHGFWILFSLDLETREYADLENREAAKIIGVSDARVRQLRLSGELRAIKIDNRTWMIPRSEAEKFALNRPKVGRPRGSGKNKEKQ